MSIQARWVRFIAIFLLLYFIITYRISLEFSFSVLCVVCSILIQFSFSFIISGLLLKMFLHLAILLLFTHCALTVSYSAGLCDLHHIRGLPLGPQMGQNAPTSSVTTECVFKSSGKQLGICFSLVSVLYIQNPPDVE